MKQTSEKQISELRQDIVTGEWVVIATARARRPNEFAKKRKGQAKPAQPKAACPFEVLAPDALVVYDKSGTSFHPAPHNRTHLKDRWWLEVIPNKYPAFGWHGACAVERQVGPYHWQDGVGFHEIVVTRDHDRSIAAMTTSEVKIILQSYRERYLALKHDPCVAYVSIFHNHGPEAGASVAHPHSQIIAIPVIPPDVGRSLRGSAEYFREHHTCVHCTMIAFEQKEETRIIYENEKFVVLCPYVSRSAFEVRIFPKVHEPEFAAMRDADLELAADALETALAKLAHALTDPDYNFFIHTAPVAGREAASSYHWHIEIIPKTAIWAGFEIGTGIEISTISPESAAEFLRKSKI